MAASPWSLVVMLQSGVVPSVVTYGAAVSAWEKDKQWHQAPGSFGSNCGSLAADLPVQGPQQHRVWLPLAADLQSLG
jgi:hypothetical protein